MNERVCVLRVSALRATLVLLGTVLLGTCTDGGDPAGVTGESSLRISLAPELLPEPVSDQDRPIDLIRIEAREVPGGNVLGGSTFEVDPGAQEWELDFSLPVPMGATIVVTLSVELMSLVSGSEVVEWSGRTEPTTLRVGSRTEVRNISLVKGPLANLGVTGITIQTPSSTLREGEALPLQADVATSTPQDPPVVFWKSLDAGVATVSGSGLVQGLLPGTARIVATAGTAADTASLTVLPAPASVSLDPSGATLDALGQEVSFQATVLDPRGNPVPGDEVAWATADPEILEHLGAGSFRAIGRGTTTVSAASSLDPGVSANAEVVIRQVVAAVDVLPEEDAVFIGESLRFEAMALDANGNPIDGMAFSWSSPDPEIVAVDPTGLVTGTAPGIATIAAEAVSEALGPSQSLSSTGQSGGPALPIPTPGNTGYASLEVLPEVALVTVSPTPFIFRSLGQEARFIARAYGLDEAGEPTKLLPLTDFTWESSNDGVATVEGPGLTADTAYARSVAEGSAEILATIRGVTGSAALSVNQNVQSVRVLPSEWEFQESASSEAYLPKEFTARAYDGLGNLVPGASFTWASDNLECFPIVSSTNTSATVEAQCGCDWEGQVQASSGTATGTASVWTPACGLQAPSCPATALPAGSLFRPGVPGF
ncbi:MAG: Ig-like domain-containing protein [Gemmatimonadota bacterium]